MVQRRLTAVWMTLLLAAAPALATEMQVQQETKKKEDPAKKAQPPAAAKQPVAQKPEVQKKDEKKADPAKCDPIVNTLEDILAFQGAVGPLLENKPAQAATQDAAPAETTTVVWRETEKPQKKD